MEQRFRPELNQEERIKILKSQAFETKEETHFRQLTTEEMEGVMKEFMDNDGKIKKIKEAAKEAMKEYKDQIDALEEENEMLYQSYQTKTAEITEKVYCMDDQENGMMSIYNEKGDLISARRLKADERDARPARLTIMSDTARAVNE